MLDAQEEAQSRTFAHEPGEGKAWWLGMVATIRANGAHFGRRSSVVAVALVILASALGVLTVLAGTAQPSRADDTGLTCFGRQATVTGIIGTNGDDVIIGSQTTNDTIVGLGGNDRICGLGAMISCREDPMTTTSTAVRATIAWVVTLASPTPTPTSPSTAGMTRSSVAQETMA
jgi:hypothetical protein